MISKDPVSLSMKKYLDNFNLGQRTVAVQKSICAYIIQKKIHLTMGLQ